MAKTKARAAVRPNATRATTVPAKKGTGSRIAVTESLGRSRVNREHQWAHEAVAYALRKGILVRPELCEACEQSPGRTSVRSSIRRPHTKTLLQAHHPDYNDLLRVEWLCDRCHGPQNPHVKNEDGVEGERRLYLALRKKHGDPVRERELDDDSWDDSLSDEGAESLAAMFADQYGGFEGDGLS